MRRSIGLAVLAVVACLALLVIVKVVVAWQTPSVPILVYHNVLRASAQTRRRLAAEAPVLSPGQFEANLKWLKENHYVSVTLDEVAAFVEGRRPLPPNPVVITFDDGWEGVYRNAYPLLAKYGFKATVFVIAGRVQDPARRKPFMNSRLTMVDWDQLRKMQASGVIDVESHAFDMHRLSSAGSKPSNTPVVLARLKVGGKLESESDYRRRIEDDFARVGRVFLAQLNRKPRYLAWPYGGYSPTALETARAAGYRATLTTDFGVVRASDDPLTLPRVSLNERREPNLAIAIAEARYGPEIYSLKQAVKSALGRKSDSF